MRRGLVISLVASIAVAVIAFAATLGAGWSPKLGLDLAGGSEVVYKPAHAISSGQMDTTVNVIRNRVDGAGVSGASVNSQGGNVVVQFPGVKDPQALINLIGKTAQLYFRPVLCGAPAYTPPAKGKAPPAGPLPACGSSYQTSTANLGVTPDSSAANGYNANSVPPDPAFAPYKSNTGENDPRNATVLLPGDPSAGAQQYSRFVLGPAQLEGNAIAKASAVFDTSISGWAVSYTLTGAGSPAWDKVAGENFHKYVAIDLDGYVESAPIIQPTQGTFSSFAGKGEISGNFTQTTAQNLALELNYGSLPVRLSVLTKETVSPSLGKSSLKAGLVAGIGGLILVLLYTILYYRILGVVVVSGLLVTAGLLWAIVSGLGHSGMNLTLDLSGVTGVIVSVGITVDSYIVYFERLKDETRAGRSVRTSVDKSFRGAFRTVLAADSVSLAAALVLYIFAVGTVRGFAFFLGLSTLLDIFTTFFFTRPLVILLGRSRWVNEARRFGISRGLAISPEGAG
ncbi:MAG TPA: protein translocase subunit SecD [Acidimicrobiales bacterium]|nr:protein translocase subunit SecD [Acidimicrobiales bacterium]